MFINNSEQSVRDWQDKADYTRDEFERREEKALEIGLDRREFYRLKNKLESDKPIVLRKKTFVKLLKK